MAAIKPIAVSHPRIVIEIDTESGQCILQADDEAQLDAMIGALRERSQAAFNLSAPQVNYIESVTCRAEIDYIHRQRHEGTRSHAEIRLMVEPAAKSGGNTVEWPSGGTSLSSDARGAIENGIESVIRAGPVAGYPMLDTRIEVLNVAVATDSIAGLAVAAKAAFREAVRNAAAILLEPVMKVEVWTPERCAAAVAGDLMSRRATILARKIGASGASVSALVPLSQLFRYATVLQDLSKGKGQVTLVFDHFAPVPPTIDDGPDDNFPAVAALRA